MAPLIFPNVKLVIELLPKYIDGRHTKKMIICNTTKFNNPPPPPKKKKSLSPFA